MKHLLLFISLLAITAAEAQPDTTQKIVSGRRNSVAQQNKPYVILISADGFRYDYPEKHSTVYLQQLAGRGIRSRYMLPSFPSLTFPNHYTIATGMYPSHHGLVSNTFYDRGFEELYTIRKTKEVRSGRWYGGVPLWVLAEQQQMVTASFFWVGSEAPVQGVVPTYHYYYNEAIPIEKRIQVVRDWLELPEETRPHLICFYLPEVDHAGHDYGPDAEKTGEVVRWVDTVLFRLNETVKATGLDVNFIFVSDHGMTRVNREEWIKLPRLDSSKVVVAHSEAMVQLYLKDKRDIAPLYRALKDSARHYRVYLKSEMPSRLHYGDNDDSLGRIGDIVLMADWPYVFAGRKPKPGAHGFDPSEVKDMRAVFYAWGPAFKKSKMLRRLQNVDVYPVVAKILGLSYHHPIDGKKKLARRILKK